MTMPPPSPLIIIIIIVIITSHHKHVQGEFGSAGGCGGGEGGSRTPGIGVCVGMEDGVRLRRSMWERFGCMYL